MKFVAVRIYIHSKFLGSKVLGSRVLQVCGCSDYHGVADIAKIRCGLELSSELPQSEACRASRLTHHHSSVQRELRLAEEIELH